MRGSFTANGQNHGKPTYRKAFCLKRFEREIQDQQVNGLDVMLYYWDESLSFNSCVLLRLCQARRTQLLWLVAPRPESLSLRLSLAFRPRFGPKVGGDQVWAYHPSAAMTPPQRGWKVPYDGPVDETFAIAAHGQAALAPPPPPMPRLPPGFDGPQRHQLQAQMRQQFEQQKALQAERLKQEEELKRKQQDRASEAN